MTPHSLDILLAFKALALADDLKGNERRVGCVLIDHFNRRTRQCDPSLETLAVLAGISRRTAIRSVNALVNRGYFIRTNRCRDIGEARRDRPMKVTGGNVPDSFVSP